MQRANVEFFLTAHRDALQIRPHDSMFRHFTQERPGIGIGPQEFGDSQALVLCQATVEVS
jgi:hypothetical protein